MSRRIVSLLTSAGFVLVRRSKHFVWRRGASRIVVSGSPRSGENQEAWVRQEIARCDRAEARAQ